MSRLFLDAKVPGAKEFNGDISKWDVSRVTNMASMFASTSSFNGDLSKWDVSSVTIMDWMFYSASSFDGDLSKWDVSSVSYMRSMFSGASSFTQTLCGKWKTSKADKEQMFDNSKGELCASTSKATSIETPTLTNHGPKTP